MRSATTQTVERAQIEYKADFGVPLTHLSRREIVRHMRNFERDRADFSGLGESSIYLSRYLHIFETGRKRKPEVLEQMRRKFGTKPRRLSSGKVEELIGLYHTPPSFRERQIIQHYGSAAEFLIYQDGQAQEQAQEIGKILAILAMALGFCALMLGPPLYSVGQITGLIQTKTPADPLTTILKAEELEQIIRSAPNSEAGQCVARTFNSWSHAQELAKPQLITGAMAERAQRDCALLANWYFVSKLEPSLQACLYGANKLLGPSGAPLSFESVTVVTRRPGGTLSRCEQQIAREKAISEQKQRLY
jgi:hypothetical protein